MKLIVFKMVLRDGTEQIYNTVAPSLLAFINYQNMSWVRFLTSSLSKDAHEMACIKTILNVIDITYEEVAALKDSTLSEAANLEGNPFQLIAHI